MTAERDYREEFWQFHVENPHIYRRLVALAREAKAAGRDRAGIGMLWEVLRWDIFTSTTGNEYKLNNNFRAHYARVIMVWNPDLRGMFETRELRSERAAA